MTGFLWGLVVAGFVVAILALRRSSQLAKEVDQLKRDQYYTDSRLKRIPEQIMEAVRPLRLQLAGVSMGKQVREELILSGRLYQDVTATEAEQAIAQAREQQGDRILLIDVRTPKEYAVKRLPGAKLVPLDELESRYKTEIPMSAEKLFVYCAGGDRSRSACDFLSQQGYTNLYNVQDGIRGWRGPTEGEGELTLIQIQRK